MSDINTQWMRGSNYVRNILSNYLATNCPSRISEMREQWQLPDADMPYIVGYDKNDPQQMGNNTPYVLNVAIINESHMERTDVDDIIAEKYRIRYNVRLYLFVKAGTVLNEPDDTAYTRVIRMRDLLSVAVRSTLLSDVTLMSTDCELKQETIETNYSDVVPVKGNRLVGGCYWSFDVLVDEALVATSLGIAETILVPVSVLGRSYT